MSKPFDATTKFLVDLSPRDWLAVAGVSLPAGAITETFDADLSTVSSDADRLIRVTGVPNPRLYHIELQASYDSHFDERVHWYNTLARYQYRLPVRSIAFLLRRTADGPNLRGGIDDRDEADPDSPHRLQFGYEIIRLWQQSVANLLGGGLAALPLAPLAAQTPQEVAMTVYAVHDRLYAEAELQQARDLSTATFILLGLTQSDAFLTTLTAGVQKMQESSFYQMILREGRNEGRNEGVRIGRDEGRTEGQLAGEKRSLILQGTRRFGEPSPAHLARIEAATLPAQMEVWLLALLDADDWDGVFR